MTTEKIASQMNAHEVVENMTNQISSLRNYGLPASRDNLIHVTLSDDINSSILGAIVNMVVRDGRPTFYVWVSINGDYELHYTHHSNRSHKFISRAKLKLENEKLYENFHKEIDKLNELYDAMSS